MSGAVTVLCSVEQMLETLQTMNDSYQPAQASAANKVRDGFKSFVFFFLGSLCPVCVLVCLCVKEKENVCIYMCACVCVCVCVLQRERERERVHVCMGICKCQLTQMHVYRHKSISNQILASTQPQRLPQETMFSSALTHNNTDQLNKR